MVAVIKIMCYDGSMNKDVFYIEPEEDITDIIAKIEGAKSKVVALVPPKKAGVFRSIVNIKLITKSAAGANKVVVLVTTDPSIVKLAAATKMPVTKDLKTAPVIPEAEEEIEESETVDVDDEAEDISEKEEKEDDSDDEKKEEEDDEKEKDEEIKVEETEEVEEIEEVEEEDKKEEKEDKKSDKKSKENKEDKEAKEPAKKSAGKLANSNNKILRWIGTHKKADIGIAIGLVTLILVAIWAFVIAPAVTITLKLETVTGNFSENVTFTQNLAEEKVSEGKFYIEEKKLENKSEVEFEATGTKNVGEKATGKIKVTHYFPLVQENGSVAIDNGATFTNSGLSYTVTSGAKISWDGNIADAEKDCENFATAGWKQKGCAVSATITVTAADAGTKYNIASTSSGWASSVAGLDVIASEPMAGGTDKTVTVVQQSDIDKAMGSITSESTTENKDRMLATLEDGKFAIDSSFKQTASDPVSTPAIGEEVAAGKKAKLTVTTTSTIFVMDETKLKEFIKEKAKLSEGYKIYTMNDPFIENFMKTDAGYIGKLKTSYVAGSTITENEVVETVKGKGIGTAKRDLSDNFSGIKTITIDTSVPWVTSVPGNTEKITVKINTEE